MLQKLSISDKYFYFELSIHQRTLKKMFNNHKCFLSIKSWY